MKKMSFIFGLFALVLGVGLSVASARLTTSGPPYEFIGGECSPVETQCDLTSNFDCKVSGTQLYDSNTPSTGCGQPMKWNVPN